MSTTVHPVDEKLPWGRASALGLQHVLVMYAGAVAVPLIVGRALNLPPEQVAHLISADLFVCGLVTLIQAMGATQWFGIKLPVMMGVTFAAWAHGVHGPVHRRPCRRGPDLRLGHRRGGDLHPHRPGHQPHAALFPAGGDRHHHRRHRHQPDARGHQLDLRQPRGPHRPQRAQPRAPEVAGRAQAMAGAPGSSLPPVPKGFAVVPTMPNPKYGDLTGVGLRHRAAVHPADRPLCQGLLANISVLMGILIGGVISVAMGLMNFDKVAKAKWFDVVLPFEIAMPVFDPMLILTMSW
jgi:NCS2 family nucleobase:cation symporter-2